MQDINRRINDDEMVDIVGGVSKDQALLIALDHANLPRRMARVKKNKLDIDDGMEVFKIEFHANRKEYEYNINASTGEIMSCEVDSIYD
jgi:uncharacterized membrane protein YkoI